MAKRVHKALPEDQLKQFADKLVAEKDFQGVDAEVMEQIKQDVYDRLEKRVDAFIMSALPPEKLEEFDKLLEVATEKQIQDFCVANIPNLDEEVAKQLLEFRQMYLGV
jgi:hypothetical protein